MSEKYKPVRGDRVRVSFEAEVVHIYADGDLRFELVDHCFTEIPHEANFSIEKVEPAPVLPNGLTVSEDGSVLNWLGENYVRQPVEQPVEVFKPGDVIRLKGAPKNPIRILAHGGYLNYSTLEFVTTNYADQFTSDCYELVDLSS